MTSNKNHNEKEILAQVAEGHEKAFKLLFDTYHGKLFNYISTIIKSSEVSEELVMDVFLKIWLGKEMVTQIENFDAFLFRVARNKAIDFLRSVAKDPKFRDLMWNEIESISGNQADTSLLNKEFELKLREAISLLSPQRRKVYLLSRDENMNHNQIAVLLGLSRNTVNNHIVEAQRFIRASMVKNFCVTGFFLLLTGNRI